MSNLKIVSVYFITVQLLYLIKGSTGIMQKKVAELPIDYDSGRAPTSNGKPVIVYFKSFVQTVAPIISSEMEYRVNMRMTMTWVDHRLILNLPDKSDDCADFRIVSREIMAGIWHPDPYIVNAKYTEIKSFSRKLVNMYLYDNHTVSYTMIINATVSCAMNFRYYPLDVQLCPMVIQSFSYDDTLVKFKWDRTAKAFVVKPALLIQFFVAVPPPPYESIDIQPERNFTRLVAIFRFERQIGSHLVQSFIPMTLVVALSWFSFWLGLEGIAPRASFLMVSILTLVTHFSGLKLELPPVAYVKAVDLWMFGCIAWIFSALTEFIIVKVLQGVAQEVRMENRVFSLKKSKSSNAEMFFRVISSPATGDKNERVVITPYTAFWLWDELKLTTEPKRNVPELIEDHPYKKYSYKKQRLGSVILSGRSTATTHLPVTSKRLWRFNLPLIWHDGTKKTLWGEIDRVSKWLFPVTFIIFCTVYWATLLIHAFLV